MLQNEDMRALIAQEMLSKRFTDLGEKEKDIQQRAYVKADDIVKFLLNPIKVAKSYVSMMRHNNNLKGEQPEGK